MNYEINKDDCNNLEELISLTKAYYSTGDIINKDYLVWQYKNNPAGYPFLFTSREKSTNQLAGQYLVIPTDYQILGNKVSGSLSLNTLTHPEHQGKGLFIEMAKSTYSECATQDNYFTIGFPNPQSYPGFVRKLDFEHLGDVPLLIKPLKPLNIFLSYFQKEKEKHGGEIDFEMTKVPTQIKEFDFQNKEDQLKYEKFWNKVKMNYPISTNKNYEFLKWRYNDHPTKKYKVFYTYQDNEITGFIILRAEHVWGFNVGIVMEIMLIDLKDKSLLKFASKTFRKMNLDFIAVLHSKTSEYKALIKNNFIKVPQKVLPQKIHFIVRVNKSFENESMLFNSDNWKLTFGDYDIF